MLKARHTHDCESCQLIGHAGGEDVWFCEDQETLTLRFGSEGQDYASFPVCIARLLSQDGNLPWVLPVALLEAYFVGRSLAGRS
jgi:hypothetical protein